MRIIFLFCLCLIATSCYAGEWIVDTATGCKVWNENPAPNESISWSGKCEGGTANGQGVLHWYVNKSGSKKGNGDLSTTIEGFFKDGKLDGSGTITFSNGNKYVGEIKDGKFNGNGTFTWINGDKYVGEYKDGKQSGNGTFTGANSHKYVGEYNDNKRNGKGTFTDSKGNKYVGEFKDGKLNGNGTLTYANGNKYVGEFKDDNQTGNGTLTDAKGNKQDGKIDRYEKANASDIIGKWKCTNCGPSNWMEFFEDNTGMTDKSVSIQWKILKDGRIKVDLKGMMGSATLIGEFKNGNFVLHDQGNDEIYIKI